MTERKLSIFDATMICEGQFELAGYDEDEVTEELVLSAWQKLVDTDVVWQLQGSFGRTARQLIDEGAITARSD